MVIGKRSRTRTFFDFLTLEELFRERALVEFYGLASQIVTVPSQSLDARREPSGLKDSRAVKP